jgi:hypothetical protein
VLLLQCSYFVAAHSATRGDCLATGRHDTATRGSCTATSVTHPLPLALHRVPNCSVVGPVARVEHPKGKTARCEWRCLDWVWCICQCKRERRRPCRRKQLNRQSPPAKPLLAYAACSQLASGSARSLWSGISRVAMRLQPICHASKGLLVCLQTQLPNTMRM